MRIVDLQERPDLFSDVARLLVEGFAEHWPGAWPTEAAALEEVKESLDSNRVSRVALDDEGRAIGWIGGISHYCGHAWELHPLVVAVPHRGRGVGRALVADLEEQVRRRGATTLWLGTDDESEQTSLAGVDLYPNVWEHVRRIRNLKGHPFSFYEKVGFAIVGVLPDANGPGKPDILMAKRVDR